MPIRLKLARRGKQTPDRSRDKLETPSGNTENPILQVPSGFPTLRQGSGFSKKFELPSTNPKETRKAPAKKSRSTKKHEKPRPVATKMQGAVLWRDCPVEIISSAKANVISGAIPMLVDVVASVKVPPSMNSSDVPSNEKEQQGRTTDPSTALQRSSGSSTLRVSNPTRSRRVSNPSTKLRVSNKRKTK